MNSHRAIRRELVALYREAKGGTVDPQLCGRLVHLLNTLSSTIERHEFEDRIAALETAMAARPNGQDRHARMT